jgi:UDP-N-acetylmuramate dehydrogenase
MIQTNISLKPYNTFGLDVKAAQFVQLDSLQQIKAIFSDKSLPSKKLILGGGSNLLLLNDFEGLVIKIELDGIEVISENKNDVLVKAGAGVGWHAFVSFCIKKNWAGVENLSLIPGTVGAAPMQNIGAYGVEIKDVFHSLEALNIETGEIEFFDAERCNFGYRESFFKHQGKDKYVILNVTFKLSKTPNFKTSYGVINDTLTEMGITQLSIKAVSQAVIKIRQSKLPDPAVIGNSGSFFKNPEISKNLFDVFQSKFPLAPFYKMPNNIFKIPAGWLIEQAGWKGFRRGEIGVHAKQALVLVNYGNGNGTEIRDLAYEIKNSVFEKFGIEIQPEVNFIS